MVLLAAAVCTKTGKALVSRQFVEMTRSRVEGLLAAFPKLMGADKSSGTTKQHTFVETESVRYVYQPLDQLYMLLITTKASNILEDLETLRLFSRVIPEYCRTMDEKEILDKAFQLIFAFDEVVAMGYRENVNLAQIRTFTEMDSHEERVYMEIKKSQERDAREKAKDEARRLQAMKRDAIKRGTGGRGLASGTASSGFGPQSVKVEPSAVVDNLLSERTGGSASAVKPLSSGKALRLGSKAKDVDSFVDQLKSEGQDVVSAVPAGRSAKGASSAAQSVAISAAHTESVHITTEEKISLEVTRDGAVNSLNVNGLVTLRISDPQFDKVKLRLVNQDRRDIVLQPHPNLDKKVFQTDSLLVLKNPQKPFPVNTDVGVLKWLISLQKDSLVPLSINCWPSEAGHGCDVNIDYTLEMTELELSDVLITIPLPPSVAPVVKECDGEYKHDRVKNNMEWRVPVIDKANRTGSLEFSTNAGHADHFFPLHVYFASAQQYCNIKVAEVRSTTDESTVDFSFESKFYVDKYEVV